MRGAGWRAGRCYERRRQSGKRTKPVATTTAPNIRTAWRCGAVRSPPPVPSRPTRTRAPRPIATAAPPPRAPWERLRRLLVATVRSPSSERAVAPHAPASPRERSQTPSAVAAPLPLGTYIRAGGDGFGARPVLVERKDRIGVCAMIRTRASRPLQWRHIPIHPSCVLNC